MSVGLPTRVGFSMQGFRAAVRKGLLTQRGLFNRSACAEASADRESESLGGDFWGAGATPTVAFAAQSRSLEPENPVSLCDIAQNLLSPRLMQEAPSLSPRGSCVQPIGDAKFPIFSVPAPTLRILNAMDRAKSRPKVSW